MVTWEGSDGSSAGAGTRESWGGVQREELRGVDEMVGIGGLGAAEVCVCMYIYLHTYTHHIYIYIYIYTHIISTYISTYIHTSYMSWRGGGGGASQRSSDARGV